MALPFAILICPPSAPHINCSGVSLKNLKLCGWLSENVFNLDLLGAKIHTENCISLKPIHLRALLFCCRFPSEFRTALQRLNHYFLESIFLCKTNKQRVLCVVYNFLGFSRLLSVLHNEGRGAVEFPSYHKLACMAPLLSPQSSRNWCNWTCLLLSSKQRSSIAYALNTLDNKSHAVGQEGRLARCCSVNKF